MIEVQTNGAQISKKKPGRPVEGRNSRFGYALRLDITPAIRDSIERLSPRKGLFTQSDICRLALHMYCLANDKVYAREMQIEDSNHAIT